MKLRLRCQAVRAACIPGVRGALGVKAAVSADTALKVFNKQGQETRD